MRSEPEVEVTKRDFCKRRWSFSSHKRIEYFKDANCKPKETQNEAAQVKSRTAKPTVNCENTYTTVFVSKANWKENVKRMEEKSTQI